MEIEQITHELCKHADNVYNNKNNMPYWLDYYLNNLIIDCDNVRYKLYEVDEAHIYYNTNETITIKFGLNADYGYTQTQLTLHPAKLDKFNVTIFYDYKKYTIYDDLLYGGAPLRVSTPMHQYNTQTFNNLRKIDPELYENIGRVFPDMLHADKYPNIKTAKNPDFNNYPHTINGLMQYIEKCYQDKPRTIVEVKKKVLWAYKKRQKNKQRPNSDIFGGYPLLHLFNIVRRGAIERNITPAEKPGKNCYTFEGYTIQDYEKDKQKRGQYTCNQ